MKPTMSLNEEIKWWTRQAFKAETDAALIAFGVATGLKMAKADYGAKDNGIEQPHGVHKWPYTGT